MLDTNKIQENYEAIMKKYDAKLTRVTENQVSSIEINKRKKFIFLEKNF